MRRTSRHVGWKVALDVDVASLQRNATIVISLPYKILPSLIMIRLNKVVVPVSNPQVPVFVTSSGRGKTTNVHSLLVGKLEGKRPEGRPRRKCVNNIEMDLGKKG